MGCRVSVYNEAEIRDLWMRVYNENPNEFHSKFTKVYEVVAITSAIFAGLGAAFTKAEATSSTALGVLADVLAPVAVCASIISFTTSVIMVLMINAVEIRHVEVFLKKWTGVFVIPTIGVISSCLLVLGSISVYVPTLVAAVVAPFAAFTAAWNLRFYYRIRRSIISLGAPPPARA